MKMLLVQPFKDPGLSGESYPPIGLGFLAAAVRGNGHSVHILDCLKDNHSYRSFIKTVKAASPDLIGINLFSISVPFVYKMVDILKSEIPGAIVVLGGPHVSSLPDGILSYFQKADFAVRGEGEVPLRMLADCLESGKKKFHEVPGLIYRENGETLMNSPYFAENIEEYGIPAWDLINPNEYFRYLSLGPETVPVFFSRGCPFPCTFCAASVTSGRRLRRRGLDHIFKELNLLQKNYGIKRFVIEDEGFGVSKKFIMDFCERIKKENFKAEFAMGVGMRLDIVDQELLGAMKKSNFENRIVLGIESGAERILRLMKKQTDLDLIREKVDLMNEMGFEPTGYFILGYPGESKAEMRKTIRFALRLPIREASFTAFQPLPGTEATKMLMDSKELPENFDFTSLAQNKVVYAPKGITTGELEHIRKMAILRFYLRPKTIIRYFKSLKEFKYAVKKVIAVFLKTNIVKST